MSWVQGIGIWQDHSAGNIGIETNKPPIILIERKNIGYVYCAKDIHIERNTYIEQPRGTRPHARPRW